MKPVWMPAAALAVLLTAARPAAGEELRPSVIEWGASTSQLEATLEPLCTRGMVTRPIDPPFLPVVEGRQVQIDCDGLVFGGAPRWVEFVIGDDRLQMVWLMVEAEDQDAMIELLTEAYGEPSSRNDDYIAFEQARAAWRFEPPEILFYAPRLEDWVTGFFESSDHPNG